MSISSRQAAILLISILTPLGGCASPTATPAGIVDETGVEIVTVSPFDDTEATAEPTPMAASDDAPDGEASCPDDSQVTMTVSEAESMSEAQILTELFSDYLQSHIDASVPDSCRLKEFRIEGAEPGSIWFSVLPDSPSSNWWAGNGGPGESGWIVDKFLFVKTERRGDDYAMEIWGTGP
ncbi:MAG: hypothetical protein ACH37Z_05270 [Anaerolineae bacterium]